jgi:hypothetical protein
VAKTRTIVRYRRAKTHHKRAAMTFPLAVAAGFAPIIMQTVNAFKSNGIDGVAQSLTIGTTGWDRWNGKWKPEYIARNMGPVVAGILVHKLAGRLGINRALARTGIPFVRI